MKPIAVIPTLLTLGNGICGFIALAYASKITGFERPEETLLYFTMAGWFLLFAMIFDVLDGYVARLSRTASQFGGELDSLCDAVSFGVAPAFLLLKLGPGWEPYALLHQLTAGIAALYLACTILRLARFNVENSPEASAHRRFRGLPSPGAAGCIAALAILRGAFAHRLPQVFPQIDTEYAQSLVQQLVAGFAPIVALLAAMLMVSNVPYPHITKQVLKGKKHLGHLAEVLLMVIVLILFRELAVLVIFWGYAFVIPVQMYLGRRRSREMAMSGVEETRGQP